MDYGHYYRNTKSGALAYVSPPTKGRRLYFRGKKDYARTLVKIMMLSVEQLNRAGYDIRVTVDTNKHN